jgi:hypothetical protein
MVRYDAKIGGARPAKIDRHLAHGQALLEEDVPAYPSPATSLESLNSLCVQLVIQSLSGRKVPPGFRPDGHSCEPKQPRKRLPSISQMARYDAKIGGARRAKIDRHLAHGHAMMRGGCSSLPEPGYVS